MKKMSMLSCLAFFIGSINISLVSKQVCKSNNCHAAILKEEKIYGVILAGGSGKRLWPFSRKNCPKQFIKFIHGKTLLESTIERINKLISPNCLWAVTTQEHEPSVIKFGSSQISSIITEPASRNTAPAILLTALKIFEKDPNALLFFVPADHYIPDVELFRYTMRQAIVYAALHDEIVLLGVQPRHAACEYGYIEYGALKHKLGIYDVNSFHEKPSREVAQDYLESGNMLWNAGIFCARASVFIKEFETHAPVVTRKVKEHIKGQGDYASIEDTAFDIAVLEKTKRCAVVPAHFQWSDVGSLEQFLSVKHNVEPSEKTLIQVGANDNLIDGPKKMVALLDVNNLCIVETDDVLLIANRNQTDRVKEILEYLKTNGYEEYI